MALSLEGLPNEVLHQIFLCIPPSSVPVLQQVCRRFNSISQPLLWRHYCRSLFKYWSSDHRIRDKFDDDVNTVDWKSVFSERHKIDRHICHLFENMLCEQRNRLSKMKEIADFGYDAKDALLRNLQVNDCIEDVLARQFYGDSVLGMIHRAMAISEWKRIANGEKVALERALAGFDMFVLHGRPGDFDEISFRLEQISEAFRNSHPGYADMTSRRKVIAIADYLRAQDLVGISENVDANYHDMQNNFIGIALQDINHPSLPLISVAIYCCVAQRLGLDAHPCGFPFHVLAIIKAPKNLSLDDHKLSVGQAGEPMYMDPFRSSIEIDVGDLTSQLVSLGIGAANHAQYLDASGTAEIVRRSAKNIITSVQTLPRSDGTHRLFTVKSFPEMDGAFYASLWALAILAGDDHASANAQRVQFLPYIVQRVETKFPMDTSLIEEYITPLLSNLAQKDELLESINSMRENDSRVRKVKKRSSEVARTVYYKVGQQFRHQRYGYLAVITGWDVECLAGDAWISRMRVNELSRGKYQSFYHVCVEDGSPRYVAEDNIRLVSEKPSQGLMELAGQYFKRWNGETRTFVSNIQDEYPDD